jgi:hypothetical protein
MKLLKKTFIGLSMIPFITVDQMIKIKDIFSLNKQNNVMIRTQNFSNLILIVIIYNNIL